METGNDSLFTTTLRLNATLSNQYKSTFAAAQKANAMWTDKLSDLQKQAGQMTGLKSLGDKIKELSSLGVLSADQLGELEYLKSEYEALANELEVTGKSYEEIAGEAEKLTKQFIRQANAMKSIDELNQDIANIDEIAELEKEVERLNKQYEKMPSETLQRDIKEQEAALRRLRSMAHLTGEGLVDLAEHRANLEKELKKKEALEKMHTMFGKIGGAGKTAAHAIGTRLGNALKSIGGQLGGVIGLLGVGGLAGSLTLLATATNDTATRLNELAVRSNQFGSSTKSIQEWSYFMQKGGLEYDQVIDGFQTLQERMIEASAEPGEMRDNFKKLGISLNDLKKGNVDEVLAKITNNVHMLGSEAEITKWGLDMLGGEGGKMLAQAAKGGTKGFKEAQAEAAKSGNIANEAAVKTAQAYMEAKQKIGMAWQGVVMQITTKVMPVMVKMFDKMSQWVADNQDKVQAWGDKFASYAEKLPGMFQTLLDTVKKIPEWIEKVQKFFEDWGPLIGIITGIVVVLALIPPILTIVNALLLANPVVLIIMAVIAAIAILGAVIWAFRDEIAAFFSMVWEWMQDAWDWIVKLAKSIGDYLVSAWETAVQIFADGIAWWADLFDSIGEKISNFVDSVKEWFGGIGDAISEAFNGAVSTVKGALNSIIGFMNGLSITVPDWVPEFGGKTFGFNIPKLAEGGIATAPTLAMVGEGREDEAILPLSKLEALLRGSQSNLGSGSQGITFQISQKIELNAANSNVEAEARRGAAQGAQDLAREIERIMREKQRLAF